MSLVQVADTTANRKEGQEPGQCEEFAPLFVRTYDTQVNGQVDHGAEPWFKVLLLYGTLPTVKQHDISPPPSVTPQ